MFVSKQRCNHKQLSDYPHLCCQEVSAAYVFHTPFVACNSKRVTSEEQEKLPWGSSVLFLQVKFVHYKSKLNQHCFSFFNKNFITLTALYTEQCAHGNALVREYISK